MERPAGKLLILNSVESTNNYAMGLIHQGMAEPGDTIFALEQTAGKGRLGKGWTSEPGQNILSSFILKPPISISRQFALSCAVAVATHKLLTKHIEDVMIKWPNDLYWQDRKAGGILIENVIQGKEWLWAVAGIGLNINQKQFDHSLLNPVSLLQISGKSYDVIQLTNDLRNCILEECDALIKEGHNEQLAYYNQHLYKRNELVTLKKDNAKFSTTIKGVTSHGELHVSDTMDRFFRVDEVTLVIDRDS